MMVFVPALGAPGEELLQDTLKSILVCFFTLGAAITFFWSTRRSLNTIALHFLMLLPLMLTLYALISMVWAHTYLGGVEAIRWFIFSLILFLGTNVLSYSRTTTLAWSIHVGAVFASFWTALQFWFDFSFFSQGPNPASTFVNRNFFAEFLIVTIPFSIILISRVRDKLTVAFLVFSLAFNVVALMQTGTRSALLGLIVFFIILPIILYWGRGQIASKNWSIGHVARVVFLFLTAIFLLGSIPTSNPLLLGESKQKTAIGRSFERTSSVAQATEYSKGSFSIRMEMWKATLHMIQTHPITGVGAGSWEVNIPLHQSQESQVENDYYAHNEFLQLVAEYGLVGWIFLLLLGAYLIRSSYLTWLRREDSNENETLLRLLTLSSILMLMLVSSAGFPWRLAGTGAMFALCLAIMAASDLRSKDTSKNLWRKFYYSQRLSNCGLALTGSCICLAVFISTQAVSSENKLVQAVKISLAITGSGQPNAPQWDSAKRDMLLLVKEGIAINPHYRKITPLVGDALAGWGDWSNAALIWSSVLQSRPNIVALLVNLTQAHIQLNDYQRAEYYLRRAQYLRPLASSLASLELAILSKTGREKMAAQRAKHFLQEGVIDSDLVKSAYYAGMRTSEAELAIMALEIRIKNWPEQALDGWLKLGAIYDSPQARNPAKAQECFEFAVKQARPEHRKAILSMIPTRYHHHLSKLVEELEALDPVEFR